MIQFRPYELPLKNGKLVTLRQARISDAENLLQTIKTYIPQSNYIPKLEEEIKLTTTQTEEWITNFIRYDNSILLVAEYENNIIANIDLTGSRRKIMEHTAVIGMGMPIEWRNSGLGTALISSVIEWAKANPILELIWLQVYSQNELGIGLYKKMGFEEKGEIKGFFKRDNQYFDNLTMTLEVK